MKLGGNVLFEHIPPPQSYSDREIIFKRVHDGHEGKLERRRKRGRPSITRMDRIKERMQKT